MEGEAERERSGGQFVYSRVLWVVSCLLYICVESQLIVFEWRRYPIVVSLINVGCRCSDLAQMSRRTERFCSSMMEVGRPLLEGSQS